MELPSEQKPKAKVFFTGYLPQMLEDIWYLLKNSMMCQQSKYLESDENPVLIFLTEFWLTRVESTVLVTWTSEGWMYFMTACVKGSLQVGRNSLIFCVLLWHYSKGIFWVQGFFLQSKIQITLISENWPFPLRVKLSVFLVTSFVNWFCWDGWKSSEQRAWFIFWHSPLKVGTTGFSSIFITKCH